MALPQPDLFGGASKFLPPFRDDALLITLGSLELLGHARGHAEHVLQDVLIDIFVLGGQGGGGVAAAGSFWRSFEIFATVES